jgi:hypothetical protein
MTATEKYCAVIIIQHDGALWGRKLMLLNISEWLQHYFCTATSRVLSLPNMMLQRVCEKRLQVRMPSTGTC